jgi:hypothetical protein
MESQKIPPENNLKITYLYDANGAKLRKCYYDDNHLMETTKNYGSIIYRNDHPDYFFMPEGTPPPPVGGEVGRG